MYAKLLAILRQELATSILPSNKCGHDAGSNNSWPNKYRSSARPDIP